VQLLHVSLLPDSSGGLLHWRGNPLLESTALVLPPYLLLFVQLVILQVPALLREVGALREEPHEHFIDVHLPGEIVVQPAVYQPSMLLRQVYIPSLQPFAEILQAHSLGCTAAPLVIAAALKHLCGDSDSVVVATCMSSDLLPNKRNDIVTHLVVTLALRFNTDAFSPLTPALAGSMDCDAPLNVLWHRLLAAWSPKHVPVMEFALPVGSFFLQKKLVATSKQLAPATTHWNNHPVC
jgi:hypothetical protein